MLNGKSPFSAQGKVPALAREKFPTPHGLSGGNGGAYDGHGSELSMVVRVRGGVSDSQRTREKWPTPKSSRSGPDYARVNRPRSGGDDLATAVARTWPTPRASEWKGVGPLGSKSQEYRLDRKYLDATVQERTQESGPLSPDWVEWLMGFPLGWTDLTVEEPVELPDQWAEEPDIPRMKKGVEKRKERLTALGNAVVPQVVEIVARRLRELADN